MIKEFMGRHRFLSNFYLWPIVAHHRQWPSVEHAYQAAKTDDVDEQERIRQADSPGAAKRMGKKVKIRENWDNVKLDIMRYLIELKFAPGTEMADMLLETGDQELQEGNGWGDTYWGMCDGKGQNMLGKILMAQREKLRETK